MIHGVALLLSLRDLSSATLHKSTRVEFVTNPYPAGSIKGIERNGRAGKGYGVIIYGKNQKHQVNLRRFGRTK